MRKAIFIISFLVLDLSSCALKSGQSATKPSDSVTRLEMNLSAFGVESDDFPTIKASINLINGSGKCAKSYDNPAFKPSIYTLSSEEIKEISRVLNGVDWRKLKTDYSVSKTDQPTSTITIYINNGKQKFAIKDYGLEGDHPLPELYKIVYKL